MASLIRWDPFGDMRGLRERMDRVFDDFFRGPHLLPWEGPELGFPLDVYETEDSLVVKAALPGVKPEEVDISVTGDTLTIKGEAKSEEDVKQEDYHRRELRYGSLLPLRASARRREPQQGGCCLRAGRPDRHPAQGRGVQAQDHQGQGSPGHRGQVLIAGGGPPPWRAVPTSRLESQGPGVSNRRLALAFWSR